MPDEPARLDRLLEIELPLAVVVAEKTLTVGEVLQLGVGTLLTFDARVDELLELRVHDRTIALGEAVKIAGHFGFHVHEVDGAKEKIKSMGP